MFIVPLCPRIPLVVVDCVELWVLPDDDDWVDVWLVPIVLVVVLLVPVGARYIAPTARPIARITATTTPIMTLLAIACSLRNAAMGNYMELRIRTMRFELFYS